MNGTIVPVSIKGVYMVQTAGGPTPFVLLEDDAKRMMPIYIGLSEAISINAALNHEVPPRPMTHDLFISFLDRMGATINNILIDELNNGVYYARLSISRDGNQFELDARPSDCIALALRCEAPIRIQETVLTGAIIRTEELEGVMSFDSFIS